MDTKAEVPFAEKPKLSVRDLNFYYGAFQALKNINLDIPERKVTAFIGPSGCGKSTLLRTFNRMFELYPEQRAEGQVLLDGEDILSSKDDVSLIRAKIGMVFQKPTPFPMSIYDNIAFGVKLFETLPRAEMDERVEWALRKAALWNEAKDKLGQSGAGLSGGQQQRLCIARGIAIRPEVLLLDEPCSALDPISTGKIEELIHELKDEYTVVIVTHNMQQAARTSDYTAYMYLGDLIEFGPTSDVFMRPKKRDTEDYITGEIRMSNRHLSTQFDAELSGISNRVLEMGGLVESQVERVMHALANFSSEEAAAVLVDEARVNATEIAIDRDLSTIIARRQPTARDLRLLIAISKTIANLERVGDEAARIARTVQRLVNSGISSRLRLPVSDLAYEAELAVSQLRRALDAFARLDVDRAIDVLRRDDLIDQEFEGLLRKLITFMMEDARTISSSIDLIFVAKAIERVGDHAKNLAEQIIYIVKGTDVRHNPLGVVEDLAR